MPNPLTGDFEAVLQVSGGTLNRLLASIHQNHGIKNDLPHFRHSVRLRIGDPTPIDGMAGTAWVQASVPRVELIHASTDRFRLEFGIRARYLADPDTTRLPELIHGTVRAEYRLDPIDPNCYGWQTHAADYLWIRVIGSTVSFTGTAVSDNIFGDIEALGDPAAVDARITKLVRRLLETEFTPTPHRVSRRFRRGSMCSLNLGINRSMVAIPATLGEAQPQGHIDSITQDLLDGSDFAIAIGSDAVVARIQTELDAFRAGFGIQLRYKRVDHVDLSFLGGADVLTVDITYTIKVTAATAQWVAGPIPFLGTTSGGVSITLAGQARTAESLFNWDFTVVLLLEVLFDSIKERFTLVQKGPPLVSLHGSFGAFLSSDVRQRIADAMSEGMENALSQLGDQLSLKSAREELVTQLGTIDPQPAAQFHQLVYTPAGVIVRGHIDLTPRRPPVAAFAFTQEKNGFTAFESWIPGGRIDSLEWSWTWWGNSSPPGAATFSDRYLLRRPAGKSTKFGAASTGTQPLPGLDGMGRLCLTIRGVQVHPVTADLVPVTATRECVKFGVDVRVRVTRPSRLFLREWESGARDPIGSLAEAAVIDVVERRSGAPGVNILAIFVGNEWREDDQAALRDGLVASERRDAGLLVLVLFSDGALGRHGGQLMRELAAVGAELEAPLIVNEDVYESWSKALAVPAERSPIEWRLVTSNGGLCWAHSGPLHPRDLGAVLDDYLFACGEPAPSPVQTGIVVGARTSAWKGGLLADLSDYLTACPPPPVGVPGIKTKVVFAQKQALLSDGMLASIEERHAETDTAARVTAVVIDGAEMRELDAFRSRLPEHVVLIPDTHGVIAERFGIRSWPTAVSINPQGFVTAVSTELPTDTRSQASGEVP
jgi:hypothetical protein